MKPNSNNLLSIAGALLIGFAVGWNVTSDFEKSSSRDREIRQIEIFTNALESSTSRSRDQIKLLREKILRLEEENRRLTEEIQRLKSKTIESQGDQVSNLLELPSSAKEWMDVLDESNEIRLQDREKLGPFLDEIMAISMSSDPETLAALNEVTEAMLLDILAYVPEALEHIPKEHRAVATELLSSNEAREFFTEMARIASASHLVKMRQLQQDTQREELNR